ncbi:membrane protein insertase YidC [uncultured Alistipes sp.]|uniref:membrane protein insertase YidC n=1 Tax=uncultured Alistipes sp. TaxID=538949 RepID=UPI0025FA08D6|nr:membrane protein insertase YidC [uncultured Alistipes sp.]
MDKQTITGIVLIALIFLGFTLYNSKQQQKWQAEQAAIEAEAALADSLERALNPALPVADPTAGVTPAQSDSLALNAEAAYYGPQLAAARTAEPETFTVENGVMKVEFSTRGGQITDVTLKDYTKYAPKGERNQPVRMFDPELSNFDLSLYVKNGFKNVRINTSEFTFGAEPVAAQEQTQRVVMTLPISDDARLRFEYTITESGSPERDYLIDLDVRFENMAPLMANQTSVVIDWKQLTYQNEKGFKNENMYTTAAYRFPGEASIEELGMSDEDKSKKVATAVNWVAFKQQFFSSVLVAYDDFSTADIGFDTADAGSGYVKEFAMQATLPYSPQTEVLRLGLYFGPNKYAILKKVTDPEGGALAMERMIPLGWGIFGWVNRWFVIPVFDLLRQFNLNFGIIILILAILVKVIISPLTYKSYVSTAKMRVIKPEVDALAQKFPRQEDAMKRQQATMELYKKAGINPMGGCIPMLIQMPIIIAMFRFFPASIELRGQHFLWADDLSSYDSIANLPFSIPFYGDHVSLFALLMTGALFAFSYINYQQTASSQPQMAGMKFMMVYMMPLMMLFWFNDYASGLCFYYFLANLITIVQTMVIRRMIDDDKIHAIMAANAAKNQNRKKSKFQQRYEELMRQQELQQKKQKK